MVRENRLTSVAILRFFVDKWFRLFIVLRLRWQFLLDWLGIVTCRRLGRSLGLVKKCGLALEINVLGTVSPSGTIRALICGLHKTNWLHQ